ncbi:MAG: D-alanyl-D-alanine carboxypeptidase/D-alanyl-D-alanine-endopeptidase [Sedimentisphaerales bacterium]
MKKILVCIVVVCVSAGISRADLEGKVDTIVESQAQGKVRIAVKIVNPVGGSVIYSHNASLPLIPASNMKLVTTAAALHYLGPDFTYVTGVGLVGDAVAVIGSGDPILGDKAAMQKNNLDPRWVLKDVAGILHKNNVTTISDVIIDDTVFDNEYVQPNWPKKELNRWYAAEVAGINYNDNCIEIIAETAGSKVELTIDPPTSYVKIINNCKVSATQTDTTIGGARPAGSNVITVSGVCFKKCEPIRVTIDRPPAFFGYLLAEEIKRSGVGITGKLVEREILPQDQFKLLAVYRTPIWDVFDRCNKDSLEVAAESLLKTIAAYRQLNGKGGSWAQGKQFVSDYLVSLGVSTDQFVLDDGCGLSENNRLSANLLTAILLDIYKKPEWQKFKETLAVGGEDGTIDKWFNEPKYRGKIFAKTGYIGGVKSLSGVCTTETGDRVFSIITNNTNGKSRQAINDIVKAIIDESR